MRNLCNSHFRCAGLAFAILAAAGAVQARNDKLLLPLDTALRSAGTRQLLGQDIPLRFGKASAAGTEIIDSSIVSHGVADPYSASNNNYGGRRERRSDEQTCLDAFRKAVFDLQQRARSSGATAVVGIVSNYNQVEMDSPQAYECHVGHTRAVVDLKGQFARSVGHAAAAPAPRSQPAPSRPAPPAEVASPAPQAPMIASGFANISDIDAVPYLSDRGREGYRQYLGRPTPKAFALSPSGHWFSAWTLVPNDPSMPTDPSERAVMACNRASPTPCKLYAVNGSVVWTRETAAAK